MQEIYDIYIYIEIHEIYLENITIAITIATLFIIEDW